MAINLKALKAVQEDLNSRGSGDLFFYANNIEGETDIRLLPPLPQQNGIYFVEQIGYWINKKFYLSPRTFDKDCPIEEEIDDAKSYNDPDINELLNSQSFQRKSRFIMPILLLNCKFDSDGECTKLSVEDGKAKVLVAGPQLMKAINKIVVSRNFQNGTEDGIMDRVKGHNIILDKTGKKLDTEYTAMGWNYPWEMDEKFYEPSNIPDIIKLTEDDLHSDKYLRAVVRNYLYGESMPKEDKAKEAKTTDDDDEDETPKRGAARGGDRKPETRSRRTVEDEDEEDKPKRKPARRDDDDDEEEQPKRKPAPKKVVEEADDEEDKPKKPARKVVEDDDEEDKQKRKPVPKKEVDDEPAEEDTRPKRRSVISDLDNID